jgi:pimeloyl-ACP methyl ester carboxylesterase
VLLVVGAEDHVVPLGRYATPAELARLGDFAGLSEAAVKDIPRASRVVIPECGHIPHLEHPGQFRGSFGDAAPTEPRVPRSNLTVQVIYR